MLCVKSLHIKNYKHIKEVELNNLPEAQWIILTGENGYGKTLILQAIAAALVPNHNIMKVIDELSPNMVFKAELNQEDIFGAYTNQHKNIDFHNNRNFDFLTCYGASRLETLIESSQENSDFRSSGINRLFQDRTILKNIELELIKWKLKSDSRNIESKERKVLINRINWVKEVLKDLLDIQDVVIREFEDKVVYIEKDIDGNGFSEVTKDKLGSGMKALIGLVGDLIVRLINSQEAVEDPLELLGIVLIDEIELHLHPKLQKQIPHLLSKYFPKVQFIASTHSPITLLGTPAKSIFLKVDRTAEEGVTVSRLKKLERDISYLLPNSIFTSEIFGMSDIESNSNPRIDALKTNDSYDEIAALESAKKRLRNIDNSDFPKDLFK